MSARWDDYGDLARPAERRRYAGFDDVAIALVEERYRVAGFDEADAVENLFLTFVSDGGEWFVASDSDLADVGVLSARHLWDFGPVEATTSEHFTLLAHPCGSAIGCASVPDGLLGLAEDALTQVDGFWRLPWKHEVLMLAPTESSQLGRMIQATFDLDSFVAFATSTADLERDLAFSGFRVLLKWQSLQGRAPGSVQAILAHELAHVATRPASGPFVPNFVEEGIAEVVGHGADPAALSFLESVIASDRFDGRLPPDHEFLTGTPTAIYTSYQEAQSAIRFFVERWGPARLQRFYELAGAPRVAPGTSEYHVDNALRRTIGMGLPGFERSWADSIR